MGHAGLGSAGGQGVEGVTEEGAGYGGGQREEVVGHVAGWYGGGQLCVRSTANRTPQFHLYICRLCRGGEGGAKPHVQRDQGSHLEQIN